MATQPPPTSTGPTMEARFNAPRNKNGRVNGEGSYVFPNGDIYTGSFLDGMFHGKGTVQFKSNGAKYSATWENGKALSGDFTFEDGLKYQEKDWSYCTSADRTFWSETSNGIKTGGDLQLTNKANTPRIPVGTYDVGDGFLDEKGKVNLYAGGMRESNSEEIRWAKQSCRVGVQED